MRRLLSLLFVLSSVTCFGQPRSVSVTSNGVLAAPTNFFATNMPLWVPLIPPSFFDLTPATNYANLIGVAATNGQSGSVLASNMSPGLLVASNLAVAGSVLASNQAASITVASNLAVNGSVMATNLSASKQPTNANLTIWGGRTTNEFALTNEAFRSPLSKRMNTYSRATLAGVSSVGEAITLGGYSGSLNAPTIASKYSINVNGSSASNNSVYLFNNGLTYICPGRNYYWRGEIGTRSTNQVAFWCGLINGSYTNLTTGNILDLPPTPMAAFRYKCKVPLDPSNVKDASSDTNYMAVISDGTTTLSTNTGVLPIGSLPGGIMVFEIRENTSGGTVDFYINSNQVASFNQKLPTNALQVVVANYNYTNSSRYFYFREWWTEQDQ